MTVIEDMECPETPCNGMSASSHEGPPPVAERQSDDAAMSGKCDAMQIARQGVCPKVVLAGSPEFRALVRATMQLRPFENVVEAQEGRAEAAFVGALSFLLMSLIRGSEGVDWAARFMCDNHDHLRDSTQTFRQFCTIKHYKFII